MRKRMFLSFLLCFGIVFSGADAAPARGNARGTAVANNAAATQNVAPVTGGVAARAAKRTTVKAAPTANTSGGTGNLAKRAASNGTQKVSATPKTSTSTAASSAPAPKAARAASTQKVIQTGSKVTTATTNNAVPQECQDAFYGCMDSFCMLDNASGGRCQCNDRIVELDAVLEQILKLDQQTYVMATEGVERIQMGEAEEQIMARAKEAADKVTLGDKQSAADNKKKVRQLELAAWDKTIFDEEEDNIFASEEEDSSDLVDTFINKRGDELYKSAANMCVQAFPEECKQYGSMVQLVYAQKIRSDCIAYENGLKQQKNQSQQKLQTAQKALREAALDEYQNQNKYGTAGECAVAFAQCMQDEAGCGSDYTGCVTLAAKENVANNKNGAKAKQTTIKGAVAGANVTLAASTMESLLAKKEICQKVVKQCVAANEKQDVWTIFLRNAAPALKSAEELAEQKLRMECIPTVADCFKTACKSQIDPKDEDGSYDMCLSNPQTYKSLCKVQLEPCLAATGGTYENPEKSTLWNGLLAALAAMKVDACTKQVSACLTSDNACGADYSGCIGLDTESIADLCPVEKLTACQTDNRFQGEYEITENGNKVTKKAEDEIREYVNRIAQGLAVKIDSSMLLTCQNALDKAMEAACGSKSECATFAMDKNIGSSTLKYQVCQVITGKDNNGNAKWVINESACKDSADQITKDEFGLDKLTASNVSKAGRASYGSDAWGFLIPGLWLGAADASSQMVIDYINQTNYKLEEGEVQMYSPLLSGTIDWGTSLTTEESDDAVTFVNNLKKCSGNNCSCDDICTMSSDKMVLLSKRQKAEIAKITESNKQKDAECSKKREMCKNVDNIVGSLNLSMKRVIDSIEQDQKVKYCMTGRAVQATDGSTIGTGKNNGDGTGARFPNLTNSIRQIIANQVFATAVNNYNEKLLELEAKRDKDFLTISSKYEQVIAENDEARYQQRLATNCNALNKNNSEWNYKETISAVYEESVRTCKKTVRSQKCRTTVSASNPAKRTCKEWEDPIENTEYIKM